MGKLTAHVHHASSSSSSRARRSCLLVLLLLLTAGQCSSSSSSDAADAADAADSAWSHAAAATSTWRHRQHAWRRLLQLDGGASGGAPYNGSAVLATYPSLDGSGARLRTLTPGVWGWVNKSGPAELLHWSQKPHYAIAREAIFLDWRQSELTQPAPQLYAGQPVTCAAARHPPVPFHHCHVFVNHHYRVAYIRSPKSASTSIMNWLGQCRYNKTRNWNSTTCMSYTWERYETPEQIASIWADYFFFGFIRNPWARAYSLYKDMTGTNHFLHKHGPRCQTEWGRFCRDPFVEFDRLYGNGCSHKPPHYAYWHMMDQYHCMVAPGGGWAVDFLGRVEAGNEDWRVVVDEMNRRRLPGVPEVRYSELEHVHKVEPGQKAWEKAPQQAAATPEQPQRSLLFQQEQAGEQQQQDGPGAAAEEEDDAALEEQEGLSAQHKLLRIFKHLWGRIRGAALLSYDNSLAWRQQGNGEQPHSAGSSSAEGPYVGSNEHCIDAVSQWFGCDVDKFGYLPALQQQQPAADTPVGADAGGGVLHSRSQVTAAAAAAAAQRATQLQQQPETTVAPQMRR